MRRTSGSRSGVSGRSLFAVRRLPALTWKNGVPRGCSYVLCAGHLTFLLPQQSDLRQSRGALLGKVSGDVAGRFIAGKTASSLLEARMRVLSWVPVSPKFGAGRAKREALLNFLYHLCFPSLHFLVLRFHTQKQNRTNPPGKGQVALIPWQAIIPFTRPQFPEVVGLPSS